MTGLGLYHPIYAGRKTLKFLNCSLIDQEESKVFEYGKAIGHCTKLEILDLSGNIHINDEFIMNMFNVEIEVEKSKIKPGLPELNTVKLNRLEFINDVSV